MTGSTPDRQAASTLLLPQQWGNKFTARLRKKKGPKGNRGAGGSAADLQTYRLLIHTQHGAHVFHAG